jgi:hypothetical protein
MKRAKAKKKYRALCETTTLLQIQHNNEALSTMLDIKRAVVKKQPVFLDLFFKLPTRHKYDHDNLIARMKSGIDAIADVLKVDDVNFKLSSDVDRDNIDKEKIGYVLCTFSIN